MCHAAQCVTDEPARMHLRPDPLSICLCPHKLQVRIVLREYVDNLGDSDGEGEKERMQGRLRKLVRLTYAEGAQGAVRKTLSVPHRCCTRSCHFGPPGCALAPEHLLCESARGDESPRHLSHFFRGDARRRRPRGGWGGAQKVPYIRQTDVLLCEVLFRFLRRLDARRIPVIVAASMMCTVH